MTVESIIPNNKYITTAAATTAGTLTAISTTTLVKTKQTRIRNKNSSSNSSQVDRLIAKYRAAGYNIVADFLDTKARKSKNTVLLYSHGLQYLDKFIILYYNKHSYNIETILKPIAEKEIDVYKLLNSFVSYLQQDTPNAQDLTAKSITAYMVAARSYFAYNDIEILPTKFKNKVSLPRIYREDEQAIDANDIKEILHHCDNKRLKAYLLVLASGAMRATEALAIRECDLDFSKINFDDPNDNCEPAGVRIRKEYAKTGKERNVFISNEAARYLKQWIDYIYRDRAAERKGYVNRVRHKDDLIFCRIPLYGDNEKTDRITVSVSPAGLYRRLLIEFQKVLDRSAGLSSRKSDGVMKRRKITFHSFRRFVKTTISNQTGNSDYSEFILGHTKSSYYVNKPEELRNIYKEKKTA